VDSAAHATNVCRKNLGPWRRQWRQAGWPRRAVPGARPADGCRASAAAARSRGSPQATRRRGAKTAPAPGRASNQGTSGGVWARWAMVLSTAAIAGQVTRRWATRAWTTRAGGVIMPSAVVSGVARVRAWRRGVMPSASRSVAPVVRPCGSAIG